MDAPTGSARARDFVSVCLSSFLTFAVTLLAVGGAPPPAAADDLGSVDVDSKAAFSVLPRHCYADADTVRAGPCRVERYGGGHPAVIVWGDSHAAQQIPALQVKAQQTRTNLISFSMGLCPPMVVSRSDKDPCSRQAYKALRFIEAKAARTAQPLTVVLGGFWYFYRTTTSGDRSERAATFRRGDDRMFARLGQLSRRFGVRVVALDQSPWIPPGAACTLTARVCPRSVMVPAEGSQTRYLRRQLRVVENAQLISVADEICTGRYCRVTACDVPVFYDIVHLNSNLTRRFAASFDWAFWGLARGRFAASPCGPRHATP